MFFGRKSKKENLRCTECSSEIEKKFSFCPYCGQSLMDEAEEIRNFGMLGRKDISDEDFIQSGVAGNGGMTGKLLSTLMNSLVKNLENQFRNTDQTEVKSFPTGIKISICPQKQANERKRQHVKEISDAQIERITSLPKVEAKSNIRRLSDKVLYELSAPGIESTEDVFVSKLESGYEIKAIGKNKVYVNSCPINLPLRGFTLSDKGVKMEFGTK